MSLASAIDGFNDKSSCLIRLISLMEIALFMVLLTPV